MEARFPGLPCSIGEEPDAQPVSKSLEDRMMVPGLAELWARTLGDPGLTIAVVDGPVDTQHRCFAGAQLEIAGTGAATSCQVGGAESCSHGTHVASILFAQHGQVKGLQGIAPRCRGLIVPIFQDDPNVRGQILPASQADLARAINIARERGAHIINVSGGQRSADGRLDPSLDEAVRRCVREGVLVVAAAGNEGCYCTHVPAALPGVLVVGAADGDGRPAGFSNYGEEYREQGLLAPGRQVPGAGQNGSVQYRSGTSFATPIVSGVAALLLSLKGAPGQGLPSGAAQQVRRVLVASADPCPSDKPDSCQRFLGGTLNVKRAFESSANGETAMNKNESETRGSAGTIDLPPDTAPEEKPALEASGCACGGGTSPEEPGSRAAPDEEEEAPQREFSRRTLPRPGLTRPLAREILNERVRPAAKPAIKAAAVEPSCECENAGPLVYALGEIGYDFGTLARQDSIIFEMDEGTSPWNPAQLLDFLRKKPHFTPSVIWTLNLDGNPIYAIKPDGTWAREGYQLLTEFYGEQIAEKTDRLAIPGTIKGQVTLYSGQTVPVICPEYRGMANWRTAELIKSTQEMAKRAAKAAKGEGGKGKPPTGIDEDQVFIQLENFLNRIYFEFRNMGTAPEERAINYAATNLFVARGIIEQQVTTGYLLDEIEVVRSPICRRDSDCWDVKLVFFDTKNVLSPRTVARLTVDVSDIIPVIVGTVRMWTVR